MRFDREGRRTVAQFLNGLGVALITTLVLAPVATGGLLNGTVTFVALVGAVLVHLLALALCSGS